MRSPRSYATLILVLGVGGAAPFLVHAFDSVRTLNFTAGPDRYSIDAPKAWNFPPLHAVGPTESVAVHLTGPLHLGKGVLRVETAPSAPPQDWDPVKVFLDESWTEGGFKYTLLGADIRTGGFSLPSSSLIQLSIESPGRWIRARFAYDLTESTSNRALLERCARSFRRVEQ